MQNITKPKEGHLMVTMLIPWILFGLLIILMFILDLLIFNRNDREISIREAIGWTFLWIGVALLFNLYIYFARGFEDALTFLTAYLVEKSLSVDNLFVFLLIFQYFKSPPSSMRKVLFWGVLSALILRALFIGLGIVLISQFHWILYLFGAFLIFTGIKLWFEKDKEIHPEDNPVLRLFRHFFPVTENYVGSKFIVWRNGAYVATPLVVVLLAIETTDIIFAVDSIPAVLAITFDPFLVFTSNIFAILGLRSLYFVLSHMMSIFHYLHYGLALILVFIGGKMLMMDVVQIPIGLALGFVFLVLVITVFLSVIRNKSNIKGRQ